MGELKGNPVAGVGDAVHTVGVRDDRPGTERTCADPDDIRLFDVAGGGRPGLAPPGGLPGLEIFVEKIAGKASEEQAGGDQEQAEEE